MPPVAYSACSDVEQHVGAHPQARCCFSAISTAAGKLTLVDSSEAELHALAVAIRQIGCDVAGEKSELHLILFCVHSFVRPTSSELYALKHNDITIEKDPKRLLVTVRNGKTGYRVANTMAGAVSAYERIKARYPDAGGEDYLVLPDYPNRATASRIFQRQFNQLLDETGLKHNPVTETKRSVYCLRHTRDLHEDHSLTRQGQHLQPRQERRHQRRADRALLCQASAALTRDGEEPAEFRGTIVG